MNAQEKGPAVPGRTPTLNNTSLHRKAWRSYAPLSPFWQAVWGGILGAEIGIAIINAPAVIGFLIGRVA
jgi:hypothetical protein